MKTLGLLPILVAAAVVLGPPSAAQAVCPINDPCEVTQTRDVTLTVTATATTVTGTGIACPTDCTQQDQAARVCEQGGKICGDWEGNAYTLTGTPTASGYTLQWSGCDSVNGSGQCVVDLTADKTVSATSVDTTPPSVSFSPPAKAGPATAITASGSDNSGVAPSYDWTVDGGALGTHASSIDLSSFAEGSHTVAVRTVDGATNQSNIVSHSVTLDKSASVTLGAIPAFVNSPPSLTFNTDADVPAGSRQCGITATLSTCSSPFAPTLPADGSYTYTVAVTDDVGNSATSTRSFVLDRTAPSLSFTDGPSDGQVVGTRSVTYTWTASDANPDAIECAVDGAAFGACANPTSQTLADLTDGSHSFAIRATDKAGNQTTRSRSVVVSVPVQQTPQDTPQQQTPGNQQQNQQTPPATLKNDPAKLGTSFKVKGSVTQVKKLALSGLPTGATVTLTCKGMGCPKKIGAIAVKAGKADLAKAFKKAKLKSGATITIVVKAPGYKALTIAFKARKAKQPVKTTA